MAPFLQSLTFFFCWFLINYDAKPYDFVPPQNCFYSFQEFSNLNLYFWRDNIILFQQRCTYLKVETYHVFFFKVALYPTKSLKNISPHEDNAEATSNFVKQNTRGHFSLQLRGQLPSSRVKTISSSRIFLVRAKEKARKGGGSQLQRWAFHSTNHRRQNS